MHTKLRPRDVPGTLLNIALLNLGSSDPTLRSTAYNLLCALTQTFNLKIEGQLLETSGLCIPGNNTLFIAEISKRLAQLEPHLTLEFLDECIQGFSRSSIEMKHLCLEYITPWLRNLTRFCRSDDAKRQKVHSIIDKLITLTIEEEQMYPSIQTKIWGNLGQVPQLLGLVLDSFIQRSVSCGLGSLQAEIMADTSVALAAANVQLVSKKVLSKLCRLIEKTCSAPTTLLEQHQFWPEIAPMLRYLLMLSFNNCLDIRTHLPRLFHIATLLVCTGPISLRASMHGFVINVIHSLCTSALAKQLSEKTVQQLCQLLAEFTLPEFYEVFGIQHCKCAPISAFPHFRPGERSGLMATGPVNPSAVAPTACYSPATQAAATGPFAGQPHLFHSQGSSGSISSSCSGNSSSTRGSSVPLSVTDSLPRTSGIRSSTAAAVTGGVTGRGSNFHAVELKKPTSSECPPLPAIVLVDEDSSGTNRHTNPSDSGAKVIGDPCSEPSTDSPQHLVFNSTFSANVGNYSESAIFPLVTPSSRAESGMFGLNVQCCSGASSSSTYPRTEGSGMTVNPSGACLHSMLAPTSYGLVQTVGPPMNMRTDGTDKPGRLSLNSLEFLTDTLLEVMSLVIKEVPEFMHWLDQWTHLARKFAFQHNPALQPRAIIVLGCICKGFTDTDIKQLLRILSRALESYANELDMEKDLRHRTGDTGQAELYLIEAIIICLTRLLPLLPADSETHQPLFWVALGVLQLDEVSLYAAGLTLLEQNLITLDEHGTFERDTLETVMMRCREQFILQYKQMDQAVGLSFRDSFHFALVGHLLKGFRHPVPKTVARTIRVLNTLLSIVAKPYNRDKYQVTKDSVAYLAALLPVSEEVRKRCRLKFRIPGTLVGPGDQQQPTIHSYTVTPVSGSSATVSGFPSKGVSALGDWYGSTESLYEPTVRHVPSAPRSSGAVSLLRSLLPNSHVTSFSGRLIKMRPEAATNVLGHTVDNLSQPHHRSLQTRITTNSVESRFQPQRPTGLSGATEGLRSRSIDCCASTTGPNSADGPAPISKAAGGPTQIDASPSVGTFLSPTGPIKDTTYSAGPSVEHAGDAPQQQQSEKKIGDNFLLDPNVLTDEALQALTIAVLTTLVRYATDENESRVLYEFLADASMVFPRVFPVIHSLLDSKINYVLTHCHDQKILSAVQSIIQNMISNGETSVQQLHYLQSIGFGGLWRFSGHFSKANQNADAAQLFVNFLEVLIDSHLPGEDLRTSYTPVLGLSGTSHAGHLSSSSSLSLSSIHGPLASTDALLNGTEANSSVPAPLSPTLAGVACPVSTTQKVTETVPLELSHSFHSAPDGSDEESGLTGVVEPSVMSVASFTSTKISQEI
ncbi:hypothetical protein P879_02348 [Paragonimus westermani]|uniref:Neurofibromin 1 n=1 Tax=Paragonimus westermani TaxID=34504 RepID=A0A8T0DUC0_9TREM|nr:hypothetical protein P879_02348 [Paragonimus westermani]